MFIIGRALVGGVWVDFKADGRGPRVYRSDLFDLGRNLRIYLARQFWHGGAVSIADPAVYPDGVHRAFGSQTQAIVWVMGLR